MVPPLRPQEGYERCHNAHGRQLLASRPGIRQELIVEGQAFHPRMTKFRSTA